MPKRNSAAAYLEMLQQAAARKVGSLPPSVDEEVKVRDELIAELAIDDEARRVILEQWAKALEERPSRLESVLSYSILSGLAGRIEETARGTQLALKEWPIFGTLPIQQLNAMAIRVPRSSDCIIAFQEGVFTFVNLVSKVVAACFPFKHMEDGGVEFSTDPIDIERNIDRAPEPIARFKQFVDAYVLVGDPAAAEQYIIDEPARTLGGWLLDSAELFLMSHEYAHLVQGHLADRTVQTEKVGREIEVFERLQEQEVEADFVGLQLSMATMTRTRGTDLSISFAGTYLLFAVMELVDRAVSTLVPELKPSSPEADPHPLPDLRRAYLVLALEKMTGSEAAEAAYQLAEQVRTVVEKLWERIEPHYQGMREAGVRPSPIWVGSDT